MFTDIRKFLIAGLVDIKREIVYTISLSNW